MESGQSIGLYTVTDGSILDLQVSAPVEQARGTAGGF